jgi:hypothetical protein
MKIHDFYDAVFCYMKPPLTTQKFSERVGYSEQIQNDDKQKEIMLKAKEYWGEIVQNYFQFS